MKELAKYLFKNELAKNGTLQPAAINYLLDAIDDHGTSNQTCSALQALNYYQTVLDNLETLDENKLKEIALTTLNRSQFTGSDVYYGTKRALMRG